MIPSNDTVILRICRLNSAYILRASFRLLLSPLSNVGFGFQVSCHSFLPKADYFSSVATVVYLRKENCMYQACPTQDCNKKVIDQQNGLYRCEKCDSEFPSFKYRMILSVSRMGRWESLCCFLSPYQVPGFVETIAKTRLLVVGSHQMSKC